MSSKHLKLVPTTRNLNISKGISGHYPGVVDEFETLRLVVDEEKSIARFGDGEFNLVMGGNCISQKNVPNITMELKNVLRSKDPNLLVGIPRLDERSPKNVNWRKLCMRYGKYLVKKTYYSAFITRPDSAPWIATDEYYAKVEDLWRDQDVTAVYGSVRSLFIGHKGMMSARSVIRVDTPYDNAYVDIHRIMADVERAKNKRVLLMCGPTATCLAARLSLKGFHAVDLGHLGMWWHAHKNEKLKRHLNYAK